MADPNKKIGEEMNRFDDIFHACGDDIDENEDPDVDFEQFFTDFYDDNETNPVPVDPMKADENMVIDLSHEEHLSQKLGHLSASGQEITEKKRPSLTPTAPVATTKKLKMDVVEVSTEDMPSYLSTTNKAFEEMIKPIVEKSASIVTIEDLREIARLEHKLTFIDLNVSLYTTYLRSGTGKLQENEQLTTAATIPSRLLLWPPELKSTILDDPSMKMKAHEINHSIYLKYVDDKLRQFHEQRTTYQTQLQQRKQQLNYWFTLEMNEAIKKFVEDNGILLHRISIEEKIDTIKYNYHDRLFELDFNQQNPNIKQLEVFKYLTESKLNKELSKMEAAILKQRVAYNQLSDILDSFRLPLPTSFNTIRDQQIRQRLNYRYEQLIERTKSDMILIHTRVAEAKMEENIKKFDIDLKQFNENQLTGSSDIKLTPTMSSIMHQRFKNINQHLTTSYELKKRFFDKAPAVKN